MSIVPAYHMSSYRLGVAVAATAATTAALVSAYYKYTQNLASSNAAEPHSELKPVAYSEELIREQLTRNYAFLTEDGMEKIRKQRIVIVGVGGVGSWVATMLIRSGVSTIRIIDFDQVSLSLLNRHAVATLQDVGTQKVKCMKTHLHQIAPWADIQIRNTLWTLKSGEDLILGDDFQPTLVIDCIDNIDTKVDLLAFCHLRLIPVVSSGGAACKSDPTRLNVADMSKTEEDPLARAVRIRLGKKGILLGIPVVFLAEKPDPRKAKLLPLDEEEIARGDVDQLAALKSFRVRILPVLGTMPGMFGLALATHVITSVSGYPTEYAEGKNRIKVYDGILQSLAGQQARIGHLDQRTPLALKDVPYLVEEVYRGKSVVSEYSTRLTLSRWDKNKDLSMQNIVLMTKDEQKKHEEEVLKGGKPLLEVYSEDVLRRVEMRLAQEKYYLTFR